MLKKIWSRWLRIAEIIGNIQMTILLTVIYWVLVPFIAVPFKFLADPLSVRKSAKPRWIKREPIPDVLGHLRKQG
jgi:hypothetical protein